MSFYRPHLDVLIRNTVRCFILGLLELSSSMPDLPFPPHMHPNQGLVPGPSPGVPPGHSPNMLHPGPSPGMGPGPSPIGPGPSPGVGPGSMPGMPPGQMPQMCPSSSWGPTIISSSMQVSSKHPDYHFNEER